MNDQHDEARFRDLFERYYRSVFAFFCRKGFPWEEARDLAQVTFLRVWRRWDGFRGEAPWPFLLKTANNVRLNELRYRSAGVRTAEVIRMDSLAEVVGRGGPGPGHAEPAESPEDAVLRDEERSLEEKRRGELRRCIAELPPRMRQCLLLQLQGLKYTQIANAMGISVDTVRANLHQARVRLRDRLGGRPESPEDDDPEGR